MLLGISYAMSGMSAQAATPVVSYPVNCHIGSVALDTAGVEHTFARCNGHATIHYFQSNGGKQSHEPTPYSGDVSHVVQDSSGTFLTFTECTTATSGGGCASGYALYLGHRTTRGTYDKAVRLGSGDFANDLVASGGKWWVIWVGDNGKAMQARTLGSNGLTQTVTGAPSDIGAAPSMAFAGNDINVVWQNTADSELWIAHVSAKDGVWHSRHILTVPVPPTEDNSDCGDGPGQDPSSLCYDNSVPGIQPSIADDSTASYIAYNDGFEVKLLEGSITANGGFAQMKVPSTDDSSESSGQPQVRASHGHIWLGWGANQDNHEVDPAQSNIADINTQQHWQARLDSKHDPYYFHDLQIFKGVGRATLSSDTTRTYLYS